MLKKILALMLSLLMIMQFGTAYAEENDALPYSPDMVFATSIGIFEEGTDQTAPLTRIELATVFYNILMSNTDPYMDYSRYFTDVDFDVAAYSDFVYQCKIMNGVGAGLFDPDSQVTYAQLLKTVVAFLGYTELAESKGGYPYGYIAVAQQLELIDRMPPSIDSVVTKSMVASVFRLATNVPLMERITYGSDDVKYEINSDSDFLGTYMDITRIRGVVSANYLADLEENDELEYDQIKIDGNIFYITEACSNIINDIGCEVDVYVKAYKTSRTSSIMYYELCDSNNIITVDGDDVGGLSSGKIEYYDNEKTKTARIAGNTKVVYNGTLAASYDESTVNPFDGSSLEGSLKLIDNDNDGVSEVVIVDAYRSYIVKNVVNNVIFTEICPEEMTIDLGSNFKDGDIEITNVIGQPIMLSEIEADDIINVSLDLDDKIKRIVVTIDTFSGTVNGINESESIIDIDGFEFEMSKNLINNPESDYNGIQLGAKATLYFNKDGKVSDIKVSDAKYKTGYLVAARTEGIDNEWIVRIFSSSGNFEDLTLSEKVRLASGGRISASDLIGKFYAEADEIDSATGEPTGNKVAKFERQVVLYKVNEDGKINWIDFAEGTEIRNGLYKMPGFDGTSPKSLYYRSSQKNFGAELLLSASTVVFNVPPEEDADNWSRYYVESSSYYGNDGTYTTDFVAYSTDENGSPCAEVLVEYDGTKAIESTADAFVIDKVTEVIDENGEEKLKISGFIYGTLTTYYGDTAEINDCLYGETLERGDIIRIKAVDGDVKSITKVFDFDRKIFLVATEDPNTGEMFYTEGTNPTYSNYYYSFRCTYGDVTYNDGKYIKVKPEGSDVEQAYPLSGFKIVEVDFSDDDEGVLRTSGADRVFDTQSYPGYSSKIVIHTKNGDARTLVLYNGLGGAN